jgi:hypothetical protein
MHTMPREILKAALLAVAFAAAAQPAPPTAAATARAIRDAGLDPETCYRVRDLSFTKEDIKFYFNDGFLIFSRPVLGERLAAVFSAESEGGDGEILLLPPTRAERQSLARYTKAPNLDEHFRTAVFVFTDGSGDALLNRIQKESLGRAAPEMGPLLAEQWSPVIGNVSEGFTIRLAQDLLNPVRYGGGFLLAAVRGRDLGNFDVLYEPRAPEQVLAAQLTQRDGRAAYDVWTSFAARPYRTGSARRPPADFTVEQYRITASLDQDLRMQAVTRAQVRLGAAPVRLFPFEVSRAIEVTGVTLDGAPAELLVRESERGRALRPGENDVFLIAAPDALPAGSTHEIEFQHEGRVITSPGRGVYYVGARANWYPSPGDAFAEFDLTFSYPRHLTLVTAGDVVEDRTEGEWRTTRRRTPRIRMAGFNLGDYEKLSVESARFTVDVFGNRNLEPALRPPPRQTIVVEPRPAGRGATSQITTILQTPPAPDPLARVRAVANDVAAALQYFSGIVGPPPLERLTVSPIPDTFGQGFPGIIYISTLAFLNPEERPPWVRGPRQQVFFSDMIQAHEVAHQWWGNLIGPESYQDDWLLEALAQYFSLLWLEKKKGARALEDVLEDYREDLLKPDADGQTLESAGPMTWGYRLRSPQSAEAYQAITYEKGAWVLHMLRQRLGNERFLQMLGELRRRYEFRSLSTRDFQALVKEFLPPRTPADAVDLFFDHWVYSTGIPGLRVRSSQKAAGGAIRLTGTVEQTGVESDFSVEAPVEIQFAKSPPQTVWVRTSSDPASFAVTLKQAPTRVTLRPRGILARK